MQKESTRYNKYFLFYLLFIVMLIFVCLSEWLIWCWCFPNYLLFIPQTHFKNAFFEVDLCSFIINLKIEGKNVLAYYRLFQCEENFMGKWTLEHFINFSVFENSTVYIVKTYSELLTQHVFKIYTFFKNESYFLVNITKTYFVSGYDMNNQIIVDILNNGFFQNETLFTFFLAAGREISIQIVRSNYPVVMQFTDTWSELQLDFNGQRDRDLMFHGANMVETALIKVSIKK